MNQEWSENYHFAYQRKVQSNLLICDTSSDRVSRNESIDIDPKIKEEKLTIEYFSPLFFHWFHILLLTFNLLFYDTVKPEYNDHPRDSKIVAVVDRWSLFGGGR